MNTGGDCYWEGGAWQIISQTVNYCYIFAYRGPCSNDFASFSKDISSHWRLRYLNPPTEGSIYHEVSWPQLVVWDFKTFIKHAPILFRYQKYVESSFELNFPTYASCADGNQCLRNWATFKILYIPGFVDIFFFVWSGDRLATCFCWEELSISGAFHCSGTSEGKLQHPSCHIPKAADHSQHSFTHVSGKLQRGTFFSTKFTANFPSPC